MTLASELCSTTLDRITERLALEEREADGGGPHLPLTMAHDGSPVGAARLFEGDAVDRVVCVSLVVPAFRLDSHMIFAFTKPRSAVPHFTLDSVFAGDTFAFHLDLIPRVDLAVSLAYMDAALTPLTAVQAQVRDWPGITKAQLSPRQLAVMSPWMLAHRATEDAFAKLADPVGTYLEHWLRLVDEGLPDEALAGTSPEALAARDATHRPVLFDPNVDPIWGRVEGLVGEDACDAVRSLLVGS